MSVKNYSEFRYGKLVGPRDSGYHLVARTAILTDEAALKKIVKTYSFWGTRPPTGLRWALGLTHKLNGLMIIKKEPAVYGNGCVAISGQRGFDIARYVTVSSSSVKQTISAQTFRLLDWISKESVQLQDTADYNLAMPQVPVLDQPLNESELDDALNMVYRSAQMATDKDTPLLLLALELLLSGKRLLFAFERDALDFWKSLLLLLPAACRTELAIAMGTVDEAVCNWAHIIVKDGESSSYNRPHNLLKVNLTARSIEGEADERSFRSPYIELLRPLLGNLDNVKALMQVLDAVNSSDLSLSQVAKADLPQN